MGMEHDMKRAIHPDDKAKRRRSLLNAARDLYLEQEGGGASVAAIAQAAGVAKGTVYLYFKSREAIDLALFSDALDRCFDAMDGTLAASLDIGEMIPALCRHLAGDPILVRMGSRYSALLEGNADYEAITAFKQHLNGRLLKTGNAVGVRFPQIGSAEGIRLLIRSFAAMIGLWQMADPAPIIRDVLETAHLADLEVDFYEELPLMLENLWLGALWKR